MWHEGVHRHINSRRQQTAWFARHSLGKVVLRRRRISKPKRAWEGAGEPEKVGGGLKSAWEQRERKTMDWKRLQRESLQTVTLASLCPRVRLLWTFWGGGGEAWQDEGALRTHLPLFLFISWMSRRPVHHKIKPLWHPWISTHGAGGLRNGHGHSWAWLRVHVSVDRWVLSEAGYGDNGGVGLVSGSVGDHTDLPLSQRHGLQQGRTI